MCIPPPVVRGGGHTRWAVNSLEDASHCSVLYLYVSTLWEAPSVPTAENLQHLWTEVALGTPCRGILGLRPHMAQAAIV